jgi:hypothetical protein
MSDNAPWVTDVREAHVPPAHAAGRQPARHPGGQGGKAAEAVTHLLSVVAREQPIAAPNGVSPLRGGALCEPAVPPAPHSATHGGRRLWGRGERADAERFHHSLRLPGYKSASSKKAGTRSPPHRQPTWASQRADDARPHRWPPAPPWQDETERPLAWAGLPCYGLPRNFGHFG